MIHGLQLSIDLKNIEVPTAKKLANSKPNLNVAATSSFVLMSVLRLGIVLEMNF